MDKYTPDMETPSPNHHSLSHLNVKKKLTDLTVKSLCWTVQVHMVAFFNVQSLVLLSKHGPLTLDWELRNWKTYSGREV